MEEQVVDDILPPEGWLQDVIAQSKNRYEYRPDIVDMCCMMLLLKKEPTSEFYRLVQEGNARYLWLEKHGLFIDHREDQPLRNIYLVKVEPGKRLVYPASEMISKFTMKHGDRIETPVTGETLGKDVLFEGVAFELNKVYKLLYKNNPPVSLGEVEKMVIERENVMKSGKSDVQFVYVDDKWNASLVCECLTLTPSWTIGNTQFKENAGALLLSPPISSRFQVVIGS